MPDACFNVKRGVFMRKIFTKETLKHSITPILIVILACAFVFFWGRYRKVSIELTLRPVIEAVDDTPQKLDLTLIDSDENAEASISQPVYPDRLIDQHLNLRPGNYRIRGIVTMKSGKTHIVEQDIIVPQNDASIEVYLRKR